MRLADVEAMVNKNTGLVAMTVTRDFAPYRRNTVHGFPPKTALTHWKNGDAVFYANPSLKPAAEDVANPRGELGPKAQVAAPDGPVEIPADWDQAHHLKRIHIASKIVGPDVKVKNDAEAVAIIKEEIARRAEAGGTAAKEPAATE